MRRLIRVDGGVLDDRLALGVTIRGRRCEPVEQERRAIQEEIEIAVGRRGDMADTGQRTEVLGHFLRDRARGFAQPPCQLERRRCAEITEVPVWWILQGWWGQRGRLDRVQPGNHLNQVVAEALVNGQNH